MDLQQAALFHAGDLPAFLHSVGTVCSWEGLQELAEATSIELVQFNCRNGSYNDLASLMLSSSEVTALSWW